MNFPYKEWIKSRKDYIIDAAISGIWIGSVLSAVFILFRISTVNPVLLGWIFWVSIILCTRHYNSSSFSDDPVLIKILKITSVLLIIIIPIYFLIVLSLYPLSLRFNPIDPVNLYLFDNLVKQKYSDEIYPKSNDTINAVIKDCANDDPKTKLNKIFRWEMHDWHNPDWEPGKTWRSGDFPTYLFYNGNLSKSYAAREYEFTGFSQKNPDGKFYGDDPYWLAYNKVGACQELANLFSFMANKAGIKSRTVQTIWHKWVEVEINNETLYYDPWCAVSHRYYNVKDEDMSLDYKWFNSTEYFEENCESNALFMNWYGEYPYGWATFNYDISFLSHKTKIFST